MKPDSSLAAKIGGNDFVVTAEYVPAAGTQIAIDSTVYGRDVVAVNVADNHYGISMSSLAASSALLKAGIEPVLQVITRDRNRIALQSDLLGAAYLGIKNVLCLTGFHQTLIGCGESANVFDIDSIQLIDIVRKMNNGRLLDGTKIEGPFSMLIGAAANPNLKPLEFNILRLGKKIAAGAYFVQTQPVFDVDSFGAWLEAVRAEGLADKAAILAGIMPVTSYGQAKELADNHTDYVIPEAVTKRLAAAGDGEAQKREGAEIAVEIARKLKGVPGLRGIHLFSGADARIAGQVLSAISQA